jgi:hypothetical protein
VGLPAVLEPINRRNVWVVERRQHLRLALEARDAIGIEGKRVGDDHFYAGGGFKVVIGR